MAILQKQALWRQKMTKNHIHLRPENVGITSNSWRSAREKEKHSSCPVDNVPNTEDEKRVEMRF